MQYCSILLALGGDLGNQVPKHGISVPEIMVLSVAHGRESITELPGYRFESPVKHQDEYRRLCEVYSAEDTKAIFGPTPWGVTLPTRFADIEFGTEAEDEPEPGSAKTQRAPRAPRSKPSADKTEPAADDADKDAELPGIANGTDTEKTGE